MGSWIKKIIIFSLFGFVILIAIAPYILSRGLPTSSDSSNIIYGAQKILEEQNLQPAYSMNWGYLPEFTRRAYYPVIQILLASICSVSGLQPMAGFIFLSVLTYLLLGSTLLFIGNKIFKKDSEIYFFTIIGLTSIGVLRSTILTPQNMYGFLFITLFILFFIWPKKDISFKKILIGFIIGSTLCFHLMSGFFLLGSIVIFLFFKYYHHYLLYLSIFILLIFGIFIYLFSAKVHDYALLIIYQLTHIENTQFYSPPSFLDFPKYGGLGLTVLGLIGLIAIIGRKFRGKELILALIISAFLFANLFFLGVYLFPERFLLFLWIPFALLSPFAIEKICFRAWPKKAVFNVAIFGLFLFFQFQSGYNLINFDFEKISRSFLPAPEDLAAFSWIRHNLPSEATILTTARLGQKNATYLPMFTPNKMIALYQDSLETPPTGRTSSAPGILTDIIDQQNSDQLPLVERKAEILQSIHNLVINPDNFSNDEIFKKYEIKYFYTWKGTDEHLIFADSNTFNDIIYENEKVVIYQRI